MDESNICSKLKAAIKLLEFVQVFLTVLQKLLANKEMKMKH